MVVMRAIKTLLNVAILLTPFAGAQQSPSPQPAQAQPAPCAASNTQTNKPTSSTLDKWKKKLNDKGTEFGNRIGVPMPTPDEASQLISTKPAPCPPKATTPAVATAPAPAALVKLPPDTFVSLHCNPMTPSSQGGSRQTTLTLPDPKDFAIPKATDFLADSVVRDTAAKTACYLIKVDPKTGKSFVQQ